MPIAQHMTGSGVRARKHEGSTERADKRCRTPEGEGTLEKPSPLYSASVQPDPTASAVHSEIPPWPGGEMTATFRTPPGAVEELKVCLNLALGRNRRHQPRTGRPIPRIRVCLQDKGTVSK